MSQSKNYFCAAGLSLFVAAVFIAINAGYAALIFMAMSLLWLPLGTLADKLAAKHSASAHFTAPAVFVMPLVLVSLIQPSLLRDGFAVLLTRVGLALTQVTGRIYPMYPPEHSLSPEFLPAFSLVLVLAPLYALLKDAARSTRMMIAMVAILPLLMLYPLLGLWTVLFFISAILFCAFLADGKTLRLPRLAASILVLALLVPALVVRPGLRDGFYSVETRYERFSEMQPKMLYTKSPLPFGIAGTPARSLNAFNGRYGDKDTIIFTLTMEEPDALYLRHFVGTALTEDGWREPYAAEKAVFRDLYESYHAEGRHELIRWADRLDALKATPDPVTLVVRPEIKLGGAPLTPYALNHVPDALYDSGQIADIHLTDRAPSDSYQFEYRKHARQQQNETIEALRTLYRKPEAEAWRAEEWLLQPAHEPYLTMPSAERRYLESVYPDVKPPEAGVFPDTGAALMDITRILGALDVDETATLATADDKSIMQAILEVNHGGNSAHFATAATLLFRYYGIPARYVEGFVVLPSDVAGASPWDQRAITADHYHAWCEYYVPGLGFVPYESNPLYREIMPQPENFQSETSPKPPENLPEDSDDDTEQDPAEAQRNTRDSLRRSLLITAGILIVLLLLAILLRSLQKRKRRMAKLRAEDPAVRAAYRFATAVQLVAAQAKVDCPQERDLVIDLLSQSFADTDWEKVLDAYEHVRFGNADNTELALLEDATETLISAHKRKAARIGF